MSPTIQQSFLNNVLSATNNYPLVGGLSGGLDGTIDPEAGPGEGSTDLTTRLLGVTFEKIYKNIASYPYRINISNKKYITKTFFMGNNKTITVVIDMLVKNVITTTITGATGYDRPMVKTTVITPKTRIETVYSLG